MNIFDRRIVESGWLSRLSSKNIEVHARSIFLQGLLLKERKKIPSKFAVYNKSFINWHNWLYKNNQKPLEACLNFIFSQKKINQKDKLHIFKTHNAFCSINDYKFTDKS